MLAVCWIGDPAGLATAEDGGVRPFKSEREPSWVNFAGSNAQPDASVGVWLSMIRVGDVEEIEKDDNFGTGDEPPFKIDTYGGSLKRGDMVCRGETMLACEEVYIGGSKVERADNSVLKYGVVPCRDAIDGRPILDVCDGRPCANVALDSANVEAAKAVR